MQVNPLLKPFDITLESVASDKSISHRVVIFSFLSDKPWEVRGFLEAQDCLDSLRIATQLGTKVEKLGSGHYKLTPPAQICEPKEVLQCGNSGTAMRIYLGLLAASQGHFVLSGDEYLNARPMRRVATPLSAIGAKIDGRCGGEFAPLCVRGAKLSRFSYESKIASAQVKTAMILAALLGKGGEFSEPELSRDHTERMLLSIGAPLSFNGGKIQISPLNGAKLRGLDLVVPNDPSSCFFFAVAAAVTKGARVRFKNILLNKTRVEAYKVLAQMGAKVEFVKGEASFDEVGEIIVEGTGELRGVEVSQNISWLIDEATALSVAFAYARGKSVLKGAQELRVKECDRIAVSVAGLRAFGVKAQEREDGFEVEGADLAGGLNAAALTPNALIDSHGDHRIAMSFAILGLKCGARIQKSEFIATSFPNFAQILQRLYE